MFSPKPFLKPSTCLCQMGILCEPGVCSVPGSAPQTPHDFAGYQPTSYTRSHENQEIRKSVIMQVKHRDTSQHPNHLPANILHNACVIEVVKVAKLVIIFKAGKQWHCGSLAEELLKVKWFRDNYFSTRSTRVEVVAKQRL
jgi:hypothetical protein